MSRVERTLTRITGFASPVTKREFTVEKGADMHCQFGNLPLSCAVVYDWLQDVFDA